MAGFKAVSFDLGFDGGEISDKYATEVTYETNKIGGKPDWPRSGIPQPSCKLCRRDLLLLVQIYAPVQQNFHRTLYLFACVYPGCWNKSDSWTCIRCMIPVESGEKNRNTSELCIRGASNATDWLDDADCWGEESNLDEGNGNAFDNANELASQMKDCLSLKDNNANVGDDVGAAGILHSPVAVASAEIEADSGAEGDMIAIDTPVQANVDILALFNNAHSNTLADTSKVMFQPRFIQVSAENVDEHVDPTLHETQVFTEYERREGPVDSYVDSNRVDGERYERSQPAHADMYFHKLYKRLKMNPAQIVRYCREENGGRPLLLRPVPPASPVRCVHCRAECAFEFQLLSTIISYLQVLNGDDDTCLEFGTAIVYTCKENCWNSSNWRVEHVVVQSELNSAPLGK